MIKKITSKSLRIAAFATITAFSLTMNSCGNIKNEIDVALTISVPTSTVFLKKNKMSKCSELYVTPIATSLESQSFEVPSVSIHWEGEDPILITRVAAILSGPQLGAGEMKTIEDDELDSTFTSWDPLIQPGGTLNTVAGCGLRFGGLAPANIGTIPGFISVQGYTGGRLVEKRTAIAIKVIAL